MKQFKEQLSRHGQLQEINKEIDKEIMAVCRVPNSLYWLIYTL